MSNAFKNLVEDLNEAGEAINPKPEGTAIVYGIYGHAYANGRNGLAVARGFKSHATATGPNGKATGREGTKLTLAYWANGKKIAEKTGLVVSDELYNETKELSLPLPHLRPFVTYKLNSDLQFEETKPNDLP